MISVAMTTYNGGKYIQEQIASILHQSQAIDELIICDDCSLDDTVAQIEAIQDERIRLYKNKENLGYIENFYQAISYCKGEYIFLSDQDDAWNFYKVEKMMKIFQEEKAAALCTNFSLMDENSAPLLDRDAYALPPFLRKKHGSMESVSLVQLIFGNIAPGCTYLFSQEVKEIYLQMHFGQIVHDHQLLLIAANVGKVLFVNEELISYRLHAKNSIGFAKPSHKVQVELRKPKKEPLMSTFFKLMNEIYPVENLNFYLFLYQLRIPALAEMGRKWLTGK
jgi:glycosyltransferase involved in cell wall biosynthesis